MDSCAINVNFGLINIRFLVLGSSSPEANKIDGALNTISPVSSKRDSTTLLLERILPNATKKIGISEEKMSTLSSATLSLLPSDRVALIELKIELTRTFTTELDTSIDPIQFCGVPEATLT